MFVDVAKIQVKAGKGGDGIVSFRREKYIAAGGPNGGNGGKGGDVVLLVSESLSTLMDFKYKKIYKAKPGEKGGPNDCTGRGADDLVIKVPPGTIIKDANSGKVLADLTEDGQSVVIAKGGMGGRGNARFATSTRQIPRFAETGEEGEEKELLLELKLIADVGLIGYPNVGKSTFLSAVTAARPKIADYHFTTLEPNLGVVSLEDTSFVLADIPGLIEGAHTGIGLGHQFLRHVERTRILIHVVDISGTEGRTPLKDFYTINSELEQFNEKLFKRKQIVVANKMDIPEAQENFSEFKNVLEKEEYEVYPISAVTGEGLKQVLWRVAELLKEIPYEQPIEVQEEAEYGLKPIDDWKISKDNDVFIIEGEEIKNIMRRINFDDNESLRYFHRALKKMGVNAQLEKMEIEEGDTVRIYDIEFEYTK